MKTASEAGVPAEGGSTRAATGLLICCAVLTASVLYLGWAAEKSGRYFPGERAALEAAGRLFFSEKPKYDGTLESVSRQDVLILQTAFFFAVATTFYLLAVRLALGGALARRTTLGIVMAGAVLLRAAAVPSRPALETDYHRYLWDGAAVWSGLNPYQFAPVEVTNFAKGKNVEMYPAEEKERLERLARLAATPELADHVRRINHPSIPTIYPPAAQALFGAAYGLAPGSATVLKALVAAADLAVCGLVLLLLRRLGRDARWCIAYAWCPLIVKEYAATGHYDPLATGGVLAALLLLTGERKRPMAAGAVLAFGALAKLFPLLLAPLLAGRLGRAGLAVLVLVLGAGYAPFLGIGSEAFDGLVAFGTSWEFNSSLFACLEMALGPLFRGEDPLMFSFIVSRKASQEYLFFTEQPLDAFGAAKVLAALALAAVVIACARARRDSDTALTARAGIVVVTLLALAPVCDPWYFGWAAPFACVFRSAAAAWLAWSMGLYYFYFLAWRYPEWSRLMEYLPALALLVWDIHRWRRELASEDEGRSAP
ncbi:MAG: DUF2029 domain-containing protein [Candidatus Wallbacteria bacterium]|nr:DUF2029 domain-containing protein [Candidatus Wallbacteria bacterium]